jgi:uncharacterized protein (TIGR03437 family)
MVRPRFIPLYFCFAALGLAQNSISTVAGGSPPVTPVAAAKASVGDPARVAADASGNTYFGSLHSVFRVNTGGMLERIAGNGRAGYTGDGGPATQAQLMTPSGIAVDGAGNVYVADRDASVIRKIAPGGIISTVAGTGTAGYNGDGQPAVQAQLNSPMGLAIDSAGNLFIADMENHRIRKIGGDGAIATVAGNGNFAYAGDGGPATNAALNEPEGVAVDAGGNIYIADTVNDRVREVTANNGNIVTIAGTGLSAVYGSIWDETGVSTTTGDNGPATSAAVVLPTDVAVDRAGNLYIADYGNARIRVVTKSTINTLAGRMDGTPLTDGQAAISSRLEGPTGLATDAAGDVYFAEGSIATGSGLGNGDYRVWKVTPAGILNLVAGNGLENYSGDGGAAALAQLNGPASVAIDPNGAMYLADSQNHRIRRINPNGTIETVAGNGTPGFSGDGGAATKAQLNGPLGVAVDATGIYIADTNNNRIRKVAANGVIFTLGGNGNASFYGDETQALQASVHAPEGLAVAPDGTLYIADTLNQRVRKIGPDGVIHTVAGNGLAAFSGDAADATKVSLNEPAAVALDSNGKLYIADRGNNRIRAVAPDGSIATIAGNGNPGGGGDGFAATSAPLAGPQGVAVDGGGNVYIAEFGHSALRKVGADGTITTIAGNGSCCYSGDGGPGVAAALNSPWGVAVDATGDVYFSDFGNNAVRAIGPAASTPTITTVTNGASNQTGALAPGEVVVVYGTGLGPGQLVQSTGSVATQLAGVSVLFNGTPGQMLYAFAGQASAVVPPGVTGPNVQIVVTDHSFSSNVFSATVAAAAPALFTSDNSGAGQAAAANQDGTANGSGSAAAAGSTVTLLATGTAGFTPTVTIGGQAATVVSTWTPRPGILAITVQVPGGLTPGAAPVLIGAGGVSSPGGVTIAVR